MGTSTIEVQIDSHDLQVGRKQVVPKSPRKHTNFVLIIEVKDLEVSIFFDKWIFNS